MANDTTKIPIIFNNIYTPYYYQLSIINDGTTKVLSSSTMLIDHRDDVSNKIEELKTFIIRLWDSNCMK